MEDLKSTTGKPAKARTAALRAPCREKTRILIADGDPAVQQALTDLINGEIGLAAIKRTEGIENVSDVIEAVHADIAVIQLSGEPSQSKTIRSLRLKNPNLPIILLSVEGAPSNPPDTPPPDSAVRPLGEHGATQVKTAVRYVQSLLESRIFGFTVCVRI
jgi:hypothetical protein